MAIEKLKTDGRGKRYRGVYIFPNADKEGSMMQTSDGQHYLRLRSGALKKIPPPPRRLVVPLAGGPTVRGL